MGKGRAGPETMPRAMLRHWGRHVWTCDAPPNPPPLMLLQTAAWGTLGTLRTFLSFSVDKDVQRLLRAIAGQGEPFSFCTWGSTF